MAKNEASKELTAIVGYLPDAVARGLGSKGQHKEPLEVRLERGSDEMLVRIDPNYVAGVLLGASHNGETGVQLLLKDNAKIDTVARGTAELFLRPIRDLNLFRWRNPINAIYLDPRMVDKLVQLNREALQ
jgi:hypothetical protein